MSNSGAQTSAPDSLLPVTRPDRASGLLGRALAQVSSGVRATSGQVQPWGAHWDRHNERTLRDLDGSRGPWWAALGDSCAQGIGATDPRRGWAALVMEDIERPWFNLSVSGATTAELLAVQIPVLHRLIACHGTPESVMVAIGANDLFRSPNMVRFARTFHRIGDELPDTRVLVALTPHASVSLLGLSADRTIRAVARDQDHTVVDINRYYRAPYRGMVATDRFHPNDVGYQAWARAFLDVIRRDRDGLDDLDDDDALTPR